MQGNLAESGGDPIVPNDIAETVMSHRSYTRDDLIYPAFSWLRENMPIGKACLPGYDPIWLITRYADIRAISRDARNFLNGDHNLILQSQADDAFTRSVNKGKVRSMNSLAFMDRPEHATYRSVTATSFMPGRVGRLTDDVRTIARQSVDKLLASGDECDFVKDFALFYPLRVIMTLLGVPQEDEPMMLKLTQQLFGGDSPEEQRDDIEEGPEAAARAWRATLEDFYDYFRAMSRDRRKNPREDLISLIANTRIDGELIDEDHELDYYIAIATAGHDTTSSSTAGGMLGLIRYPDQFDLLKERPDLTSAFVDEAIRWSVPIKHFMRSAAANVTVGDVAIRENDRLMLCYPSANRDEAVFSDPDTFKIERQPNEHLSFGNGPHMCIGQHLAKLEMRILFEEMMPRLGKIELAGEPEYTSSRFISGLKSMPVRFRPA